MIPLSVPTLNGNEWKYLKESLDTNWVSSAGPFVDRFEREVAAYLGVPHAIAVINGTAALHIAVLLTGVQPGNEVILPSLTFIASANAVSYAGAVPVLIDVDAQYWQLDPIKVERFLRERCVRREDGLTYNRATGRRVAALMPVHLLGHPCDMDPLVRLAREFRLAIVEDAAEAIGTLYRNVPVGTFGDVGCLSFNGNKTITCGGGGMIVTRSSKLAARARYLSTQAKDDPAQYIHHEIGYNYRLTNIAAAVGCAQLEQLPTFLEVKRHNAALYSKMLAEIPGLTAMQEAQWARSGFWLYTVLIEAKEFGMDRRSLAQALHAKGIESRPLWQPIHLSPAYSNTSSVDITEANRIYDRALSLPSSTGLTGAQIEKVVTEIKAAARTARHV